MRNGVSIRVHCSACSIVNLNQSVSNFDRSSARSGVVSTVSSGVKSTACPDSVVAI